eukprot:gene21425-32958_t
MLRAGLLVCALLPLARAQAPRPNIVWIMADDLGVGEIGPFFGKSPHGAISTPALDAMAAEGMRFTEAYAGYTVCAPSRTAFFTGRHSGNFEKHGLNGTGLAPGQATTTAMILKNAGYTTCASGKIAPLLSPTMQGFDYFLGQVDQTAAHNMYPDVLDMQCNTSEPVQITLPLNTKPKNRTLCMASPGQYNYTTDVFQHNALAWLDEAGKQDKPFFLYLAFTVPHAGGWSDTGKESGAPVPTDLQYTNESWPIVERDHAAAITYLDRCVGEVFAKLKELGKDEDTVVFFASDNGAHLEGGQQIAFFNSTGGLLGHKRSLYEGGMRSPSLVRWPGKVAAGSVSRTQWAFWDVLPTLAELAGVGPSELPEDMDGISIVDSLMTGTQQTQHEYLYFTWNGAGAADAPPSNVSANAGYAVRMGDWKGVVPFCADVATNRPSIADVQRLQLFNLSSDPFEAHNVAAQHQAQATLMVNFIVAQNLSC